MARGRPTAGAAIPRQALATASVPASTRLGRRRQPSTTIRWNRTPRSRCGRAMARSAAHGLQRDPIHQWHAADPGDAVRPQAPEQVRVICPFVGGGFGGKGTTWPHVTLAAMAATRRRPPGQARARPPARCTARPATGRRPCSICASGPNPTRPASPVALTHDVLNQMSPPVIGEFCRAGGARKRDALRLPECRGDASAGAAQPRHCRPICARLG